MKISQYIIDSFLIVFNRINDLMINFLNCFIRHLFSGFEHLM